MTTIVITEKTSQAKDVANAIGDKFGQIYPAQGHLLTLEMPEDVNPGWDWKNWDFEVLRPPSGFYKTKVDPKSPDNVKRKLASIKDALKTASTVIIATDCDREGEGIGRELTDHFNFGGEILRAMFTATDPKTLRKAFDNLQPASNYENLYQAFRARQQGDQIFNLTMTRSATKSVKPKDIEGALGIGRVKTPTLSILCKRELEILNFNSIDYFEVTAAAEVENGSFEVHHDPEKYGDKIKLLSADSANKIKSLVEGFTGPLSLKCEAKRRGPPKLLDLPQMQKICGSRFGWAADRTLEVAQALYDTHKILTYPRAEAKYLTENHAADVGEMLSGLATLEAFADLIPSQDDVVVRKGKSGHFCDKCLEGVSHHAVIPNVATIEQVAVIYERLSDDETRLFDLVARHYVAALSPDWLYDQTVVTIEAEGHEFKAVGNVTRRMGWKDVLSVDDNDDDKNKEDKSINLPELSDGEASRFANVAVDSKKTKPPPRFNEGSLIAAMQDAWKFVDDGPLKDRLKEAKGIGTPATRGEVIKGLRLQKQIVQKGKHVIPTPAGLQVYELLLGCAPDLVDPGYTAKWELMLDDITVGKSTAIEAVDQISSEAQKLMMVLHAKRFEGNFQSGAPSEKMLKAAKGCARRAGVDLPEGYLTDYSICKTFLDMNMANTYPPSAKQIEWVEKMIAQGKGEPAEGWRTDSKLAGNYLDKAFGGPKGKKKKGKGGFSRKG